MISCLIDIATKIRPASAAAPLPSITKKLSHFSGMKILFAGDQAGEIAVQVLHSSGKAFLKPERDQHFKCSHVFEFFFDVNGGRLGPRLERVLNQGKAVTLLYPVFIGEAISGREIGFG